MSRFVTREERHIANTEVDLAEWLLTHHPEDVVLEYGNVVLQKDHHISVCPGFKGFHDFRTGDSGNNVDYLMDYLGYTYPEAVLALLSDLGTTSPSAVRIGPSTSRPAVLQLPEPAENYKRMYAYLGSRGIPAGTITMLKDKGLLYEMQECNNIVFVSADREYCEIRGTNTFVDLQCKRKDECAGYSPIEHGWCEHMHGDCNAYKKNAFHGCRKLYSDRYWMFSGTDGVPQQVYVCESAIDAISLYLLHQKHGKADNHYISIGGAANQQTIDAICREYPEDKIIIAVDNDPAGDQCRDRNADLAAVIPCNKDWNEDLISKIH